MKNEKRKLDLRDELRTNVEKRRKIEKIVERIVREQGWQKTLFFFLQINHCFFCLIGYFFTKYMAIFGFNRLL